MLPSVCTNLCFQPAPQVTHSLGQHLLHVSHGLDAARAQKKELYVMGAAGVSVEVFQPDSGQKSIRNYAFTFRNTGHLGARITQLRIATISMLFSF